MKNLKEYLLEALKDEKDLTPEGSNVFMFDFTDLDDVKETLKSLKEYDCCSVEDNVLTLTVTKDNIECVDKAMDILQQYSDRGRNSSRRSTDENYAQKTKKFQETVGKVFDYIDQLEGSDDEENKKKDKEEE